LDIEKLFSDINPKTLEIRDGFKAIESQMGNVLGISRYQIPGRPEFATDIYKYLHEPDDIITRGSIETEVEQLLANYVDRIIVESVICNHLSSQMVSVDISYTYKQISRTKSFQIKR